MSIQLATSVQQGGKKDMTIKWFRGRERKKRRKKEKNKSIIA